MSNQQSANISRAKQSKTLWSARKSEIVRFYSGGMSQKKLAEKYGVSLAGMQKAMARMGITPKPKWRVGKANGRYIHGRATTIYRSLVKIKACEKCGATMDLCVHHRNDDHYDNDPKNLQVLCMSCHSRMHKKAWWAARRALSA